MNPSLSPPSKRPLFRGPSVSARAAEFIEKVHATTEGLQKDHGFRIIDEYETRPPQPGIPSVFVILESDFLRFRFEWNLRDFVVLVGPVSAAGKWWALDAVLPALRAKSPRPAYVDPVTASKVITENLAVLRVGLDAAHWHDTFRQAEKLVDWWLKAELRRK